MSNYSIKLGFILVILFFGKSLFAQIPNLPGLNISACNQERNPFQFDNRKCPAWKKSHGSPSSRNIGNNGVFSSYINVVAGKTYSGADSNNSWFSEGCYYEHSFEKDKIYKISFYYRIGQVSSNGDGKVEECFVKLANGLNEEQTPSSNIQNLDYTYQSPSDEQVIFIREHDETVTNNSIFDANGWVYFEKVFTPNKNYGQLWVSIKDYDSQEQGSPDNLAAFQVGGIRFECLTDTPIDVLYENETVPLYTGATNLIRTRFNVNTPQTGHTVFEAGNTGPFHGIHIWKTFHAHASTEASFSAVLKPNTEICRAYEEECSHYFHPGAAYVVTPAPDFNSAQNAVALPNAAGYDPWGNHSPLTIWSKGYSDKKYNAWKAKLSIYHRWGGLLYFDEVEVLDPNVGIPRLLSWDPCGVAQDGVYVAILELYYCDGTTSQHSVDVTVTCASKSLISSIDERTQSSKSQFAISPNPAQSELTLNLSLDQSGTVNIELFQQTGQRIAVFKQNQFVESGAHQYQWLLPELPSGMYLIRVQTEREVLTQKIIIL